MTTRKRYITLEQFTFMTDMIGHVSQGYTPGKQIVEIVDRILDKLGLTIVPEGKWKYPDGLPYLLYVEWDVLADMHNGSSPSEFRDAFNRTYGTRIA